MKWRLQTLRQIAKFRPFRHRVCGHHFQHPTGNGGSGRRAEHVGRVLVTRDLDDADAVLSGGFLAPHVAQVGVFPGTAASSLQVCLARGRASHGTQLARAPVIHAEVLPGAVQHTQELAQALAGRQDLRLTRRVGYLRLSTRPERNRVTLAPLCTTPPDTLFRVAGSVPQSESVVTYNSSLSS